MADPTQRVPWPIDYRSATPRDAEACIRLRARTRENAIAGHVLAEMGITAGSWARAIGSGELPGVVGMAGARMAGYCFGAAATGEVVVLALRPAFEGRGIGRELLGRVVAHLRTLGHGRLFLACSADPAVRSHGFYRRLGWQATGVVDDRGDERLELPADIARAGAVSPS